MDSRTAEIQSFWNSRADLGHHAGTKDVNLKLLEMQAIMSYIRDGMKVLEIGCGNGITSIEIAKRYRVSIDAFDYAENMIDAAQSLSSRERLQGSIHFQVGDVRDLPQSCMNYDLAFTERMLINLPDWNTQREAILRTTQRVRIGGLFVMCEHSQDGLNAINDLRSLVGLSIISPPWHNRYLLESEIDDLSHTSGIELKEVNHFSSTYYYISRVITAWAAAREGREPDYSDALNQLAIQLPPLGNHGQGKIWVWSRIDTILDKAD